MTLVPRNKEYDRDPIDLDKMIVTEERRVYGVVTDVVRTVQTLRIDFFPGELQQILDRWEPENAHTTITVENGLSKTISSSVGKQVVLLIRFRVEWSEDDLAGVIYAAHRHIQTLEGWIERDSNAKRRLLEGLAQGEGK